MAVILDISSTSELAYIKNIRIKRGCEWILNNDLNYKYVFSPSFSLSTIHDNDILSISTSTRIEPQLSYSPLVRRCTEALQTSMLQHIDSVVKTHLHIAQTPARDKENIDNKCVTNVFLYLSHLLIIIYIL